MTQAETVGAGLGWVDAVVLAVPAVPVEMAGQAAAQDD